MINCINFLTILPTVIVSGHGIGISSFLSHEVRAKLLYNCVREYMTFLAFPLFLAISFLFLASSLLYASLNMHFSLTYIGYADLYFCISLEWSMSCFGSCSRTCRCPPRTDLDKQTNKQTITPVVRLEPLALIFS